MEKNSFKFFHTAFLSIETLFFVSVLGVYVYTASGKNINILNGLFFALLISVKIIINFKILSFNKSLFKNKKFIVYGAGETGNEIINKVPNNFKFIGFIEDNPKVIWNFRKPVLGRIADIEYIFKKYKPDLLILCISSASRELISNVKVICDNNGVELRVLPIQFIGSDKTVQFSDAIHPNEQDLFGRFAIRERTSNFSTEYQNKVVLVTGAGGSIGSELTRQLLEFGLKKLIILDRDENSLVRLQLSFPNGAKINNVHTILADIRDHLKIQHILRIERPDIIFHTAALKHVTFLEEFPDEALKTNIEATYNLLRCADELSIPGFINISSDKAVDSVSVLGRSKFITENLVFDFGFKNNFEAKKYLSVRFGNVIGSNGSVFEIFKTQIAKGGPITVRNPLAERYFMSLNEAIFLVIKAYAAGSNGDILVLKMGKKIRILDLAEQMILESGSDIEILFTDLVKGEKISESLHSQFEKLEDMDSSIYKIVKNRAENLDIQQMIAAFKTDYNLENK
jgi:FlaA1/EpsC-like NDP-sugar epimerase